MLNTLFQKPSAADRQAGTLVHAEYSLLAEGLLRATSRLLVRSDTSATVQHLCDSIVEASPNIVLAWVWFGDPGDALIVPQIIAGPARAYAETLRIERSEFNQISSALRALNQPRTRAFDVAARSWFGPWREAANRHGVRSVLVVPVASGGDERGLLALYATRDKYFDEIGPGLFETLGELLYALVTQSRHGDGVEPATDAVTGLPLRRQTQRRIEAEWSTPSAHDSRGLLAIIDVDQFRAVNDRYGRQIGDHALRQIAHQLRQSVRRSDLVSRWAGDEFLVWLPGVSGAAARVTAEKLLNDIAAAPLVLPDGSEIALPVSIGAAPVNASDNFAVARDRAGRALRKAKEHGGCLVIARFEN